MNRWAISVGPLRGLRRATPRVLFLDRVGKYLYARAVLQFKTYEHLSQRSRPGVVLLLALGPDPRWGLSVILEVKVA